MKQHHAPATICEITEGTCVRMAVVDVGPLRMCEEHHQAVASGSLVRLKNGMYGNPDDFPAESLA